MTTRWIDLRFALGGAGLLLLASLVWNQLSLLTAALLVLLLLLLVGAFRLVTDANERATNGGGFPSQVDAERENDHDFDILNLEQTILTRLNQVRQERRIMPVGLNSDLLFWARRHSLRMIKLPFCGTKDIEEGDICDRIGVERGSLVVGALVLRFNDGKPSPANYCVGIWLRRRRTRRIVLEEAFALAAVGIVRSAPNRTLYITCVLEAPASVGTN